jgi:hypothetical protein
MEKVRFDAPWDFGLKALTAFVFFLLALTIAGSATSKIRGIPAIILVLPIMTAPLLVLWAGFLGAPRAFTLDATSFTIELRSGHVTVPLSSIREIRRLEPRETLQRVGGVGGFFGYWGDYSNPDLGSVKLYATRSDDRVLLRADGGIYVVTPSSPERFMAEIRARLSPKTS